MLTSIKLILLKTCNIFGIVVIVSYFIKSSNNYKLINITNIDNLFILLRILYANYSLERILINQIKILENYIFYNNIFTRSIAFYMCIYILSVISQSIKNIFIL